MTLIFMEIQICPYQMERTSMMKVKNQIFNFEIFNCFWYMHAYNISLVYADVGLEKPSKMSPIAKHVLHLIDVDSPYQEGSDNKEEIARNLEG